MSESAKQLQLMLNICYQYGIIVIYCLMLTKSVREFVDRSIANNMPIFHMGNNDVNKVKSFVDLGVKLTSGVELAAD